MDIYEARPRRRRHSGSIRQLPSGTWELKWYATDQSGNRQRASTTVKGSRADAEKVLQQKTVDRHISLTDYLLEWQQVYADQYCSLRTAKDYRNIITGHLVPKLGHHYIAEITERDIQAVYSDLLRNDLSPITVTHIHQVLNQSLKHAVEWGYIPRNVLDNTRPPASSYRRPRPWDVR